MPSPISGEGRSIKYQFTSFKQFYQSNGIDDLGWLAHRQWAIPSDILQLQTTTF